MNKATIVVDLGFGDSGKGSIVDFLVRESSGATVVRYNGGSQAAHNVVTPDGKHHTFAQFGSGTLVPGTRTFLSRFMLVDLFAMLHEAEHLKTLTGRDPYEMLTVDPRARVITPYHKVANRIRETLRGNGRHGSCGMGVGETMADDIAHPECTITVGELQFPNIVEAKLRQIQHIKFAEFEGRLKELTGLSDEIAILRGTSASPRTFALAMKALSRRFKISGDEALRRFASESDLIFEGAQGVLLDEWYGFHPYTTWSTTTTDNAVSLLNDIDFDGEQQRLGLLRAYFTRHGQGPFPTEDPELGQRIPDVHNGLGQWQGAWRVGWFDSVLARYAITVSPVDCLAITNIDRLARISRKVCTAYSGSGATLSTLPVKSDRRDLAYQEHLGRMITSMAPVYESVPDDEGYLRRVEELCLGVPVSIVSRGQLHTDKVRLQHAYSCNL